MKPIVDIVIPSLDNSGYLSRCISSVCRFTPAGTFKITVVNNGSTKLIFEEKDAKIHQSLTPGKNLKWTRAINLARNHTKAPFVMMLNDDTQVLDHDYGWLYRLLQPFKNEVIGATGPISNYAMGFQAVGNLNVFPTTSQKFITPVLSGFCMLMRRSVLDELDWLDEDLEDGSEDVDYCLRMRMAGYECAVCRDVFIYHVGSVTADKMYPEGWWNSNEYSVEQRMKLLRKFGVSKYYELTQWRTGALKEDKGRELISDYIEDGMKGLDLGCGPNKIHPDAVGIDLEIGDMQYTRYKGKQSDADIQHDIRQPLPFPDDSQDYVAASHFIEHLADPIPVLDEIYRVLKPEGRFLVTMPSQNLIDVIPLDPTHVMSYTPESFKRLLKRTTDFMVMKCEDTSPGFNMICIAEKRKDSGTTYKVPDGNYTMDHVEYQNDRGQS